MSDDQKATEAAQELEAKNKAKAAAAEKVEQEKKLAAMKKKAEGTSPVMSPNPPVPWFMSSLSREKQEKTDKLDVPEPGEDAVLAELAGTDAWRYLKKFINARKQLFEELLKEKVAASPYDMQEIGFRYVIKAQVDDVLSEIVNRVENFAQIVAADRAEKQQDDSNS